MVPGGAGWLLSGPFGTFWIMGFTDLEVVGLRRMLLAFGAGLPRHELGYWYVTSQPLPVVVENADPPGVRREAFVYGRDHVVVQGYAECVRCRKRFDIPRLGSFRTSSVRLEETVARAKEWVLRDAERDGPCWGDVPYPGDRSGAAVMDGRVDA